MLSTVNRAVISTWLMLAASVISIIASLIGLVDETLYRETVAAGNINDFLRVGSLAQDLVTVPLASLLLVLSFVFLKSRNTKVFITMLGLVGYLFYAYGLYTMQAQYTDIHLLYLVIFGLSIYALVYGLSSFDSIDVKQTFLPKSLRIAVAGFLASVLIVLVPVWMMLMLPAIAAHKPADTYGVFVLDLAIVFPALAIVTLMLIRNRVYGDVFAGVALFKAFTVCLSVAFGEWFVGFYGGFEPNGANILLFGALAVVSGVLFVLYLRGLKLTFSS